MKAKSDAPTIVPPVAQHTEITVMYNNPYSLAGLHYPITPTGERIPHYHAPLLG